MISNNVKTIIIWLRIWDIYTGMLISPWSDLEGNNLMFLPEWREFPSEPCLAGGKSLITARVSMLLKSRASLTCLRSCFLSGLG